ncbi:MAG: efflux RND transporter permease subunit [Spirochaetes bacterium]|nr:efflux RND transporter permease subunit [Spirochaetota bacterium]
MFLVDLSIKRPVMISMLLAALILFGGMAFFALPLNQFPDVEFPFIIIQTIYPGANPTQVAEQVTRVIEDAVTTVSGIRRITSYSMDSASIIVMQFHLAIDPNIAQQDVRASVDTIINDLPDTAHNPIVRKFDIQAIPIIDLILSGNIPMQELYSLADGRVRDLLSQVPNVGSVSTAGGQRREIHIEFENRTLLQNEISLATINQILAASNINLPAGTIRKNSQEAGVRVEGEFRSLDEIRSLYVMTPLGQRQLGEIADIVDAGEEVRERSIFFDVIGERRDDNVILLSIINSPEGNAVTIAEDVRRVVAELNNELPAGVRLDIVQEAATGIRASVNDTLSNIILGIIFTALILLLFLHDLRSTIIVALAMPFSLIPTFMAFQFMGYSINMMTLMGLSTSVGILVMNSVIILENIFRHKNLGQGRTKAALDGTKEVIVAVFASTLTNVAVFLPLATMDSMAGLFLREFAMAIVFATMFSLLIALTLTPMLASLILPDHAVEKNKIGKKLDEYFKKVENGYRNILEKVLKTKKNSAVVLLTTFVVLIISLFLFAVFINFEFQPMMDQGRIAITVEMPQGYNLDETARITSSIERRIADIESIEHIITTLGRLTVTNVGTNMASISVQLVDTAERRLSHSQYASIITSRLADIPGAAIQVSAISGSGQGGGGAPISFFLLGQEFDTLEMYKDILFGNLAARPGFLNLDTSFRPGRPEITITPDRRRIAAAGITVFDIAMNVRSAIEGMVMTTFREGGREYDIRVVLRDEEVQTFEDVNNISIVTPRGIWPLSHFANIEFTTGFNQILRIDKFNAIQFTSDIAPGFAQSQLMNIVNEEVAKLDLPLGYSMVLDGMAEEMVNIIDEMIFAFILAVLITYMLLAAILEKLFQPIIMLSTIPLSLIGVTFTFLITGSDMNFISMMAIVMLVGIVVTNAILILDYTNQLTATGVSTRKALLIACPIKLRPILIANIAAILGMLPMALGIGDAGVEMRQPMGLVSIGGIITSAFLSLIVIPAIENVLARRKNDPAEAYL